MAIDRAATLKLAEQLVREGRVESAVAEYQRLAEDRPSDWNTAKTLGDLCIRVGQVDAAVEHFARVADCLLQEGFLQKASAIYKKILKLKADHEHALSQAAEIAASQGLLVDARAFLARIAEGRLARGDAQGAAAARSRLESLEPANAQAPPAEGPGLAGTGHDADERPHVPEGTTKDGGTIAPVEAARIEEAVGNTAAETACDDPHALVRTAEAELDRGAAEAGLAILRRLLERHPERVEEVALLGWRVAERTPELAFGIVELSADAAVARENWAAAAAALQEFVTRVPDHIPALRRLVEVSLRGGLEATAISAQANLADAYLSCGMAREARAVAEDLIVREPWDRANLERLRRSLAMTGEADPDALIAERLGGQTPLTITDPLVDVDSQNGLPETESPSESFGEARSGNDREAGVGPEAAQAAQPTPAAADLDELFARLRVEASRGSATEEAEQRFRRGVVLFRAGDIDACVPELVAASQVAQLRFPSASLLARIFRDRGQPAEALEWFERAAQAAAPSPDEAHALLYEFADLLERTGETLRALTVSLALQSEAGAFRDVAQRIDRLTKVQARG